MTRLWMLVPLVACAPPEPTGSTSTSLTGDTATASEPVVDPTCEQYGCLRDVVELGTYDRTFLEPYLSGGLAIDNGYRIFAIEYWTRHRPATATITLPVDLRDAEPDDGFPVVVNAHGSIGLDDPCQLTGTVAGAGLAGLFGARGAIGVMPDYPGLGTAGLHPYLDLQSEGTSVLDAIRAAAELAQLEGVPHSGRSAVVGVSQGGHASIAAAMLHDGYAPELDIRAFGAAAPANLYEEQWRSGVDVDGAHLVYHAMLLYSIAAESRGDDATLWAPGLKPTIDETMATRCTFSPDFADGPVLADEIPTTATDVFSSAFLAEYRTGAWSDYGYVSNRFNRNRLRPYVQTAPLAIWQGLDDDVIQPWMTQALVDDLTDGGVEVEYTEVPGATHLDTAFGFLASAEGATEESVAWVQAQLQSP